MYSYEWDTQTGGYLLNSTPLLFSKEPRPVYYQELDILGFDKYWNYEKNDAYPYMWAEANNYIYRGRLVAKTKGGSLYTAPELLFVEDPEPDNLPLRFVDIPLMVEKNREFMEPFVKETIKKIYNTYREYKNKVDVFYVAFSGGKDSVVALDLVQRALPHNAFKVLFGDTDMEFPTTIKLVKDITLYCQSENISFYTAKPVFSAMDSWDIFGSPARKLRWCCTVHKTAPVINKLCEIYQLDRMKAMMITGVRGEESSARSDYEELSFGKKLHGQYSFHPLLEWSSADVFLYMYAKDLLLNDAYKLGFNRVGCIMCPNSSEKHEFIKRQNFPKIVDVYCQKIINNSSKDLSGNNARVFLETGGWKTRLSGRELKFWEEERFEFTDDDNYHIFKVIKLKSEWKIWYKTLGTLYQLSETEYLMEYDNVIRKCYLSSNKEETIFKIENLGKTKNSIEFIFYFKSVLAKSQYCIMCQTCVSECPFRNITMQDGKLEISDNCIKCHSCLRIASGCLYYNSVKGSTSMKSLKGINRYFSVGVDANWIRQYLKDQSFQPGNNKTDAMFCFMNDACITSKKKLTKFGYFLQSQDMYSVNIWALLLCNLAYSPAFRWYIQNIPFSEEYIKSRLLLDMGEDTSKKDGGKKARGEFWNSFKVILDTTKEFKEIGFGIPVIESKANKNGEIKKSMISLTRSSWKNPDKTVILYSLYKFAEECGGYYQFTLTRLMDYDIESDGISPVEIFGLKKDTMQRLINGLAFNHPDFIKAEFTLDLDIISLNPEKKSEDVLSLF